MKTNIQKTKSTDKQQKQLLKMRVVGEQGEVNSLQQVSPEVLNAVQLIETSSRTTPVKFLTMERVKISEIKDNKNFYQLMGTMFTKIANLAGLKGEISDINKADIEDLIIDNNQSLSLEEIYYAFKLERYGEYETKSNHYEMFGAEYVSEVLKKFKDWKKKKIHAHNLNAPVIAEEIELSENEKHDILEKGIQRVFQEYKETGEVPEGCFYLYDYLKKKGRISEHPENYKKRIKIQAQKNLSVKAKEERERTNFSSFFKIGNKEKRLQNECKRLALKDFFKSELENEGSGTTKEKIR